MADRLIQETTDVTLEMKLYAVEIADSYYPEGPIDWDNLIDRLEQAFEVCDGVGVDLGSDANSPAIRAIKAYVRKVRREG